MHSSGWQGRKNQERSRHNLDDRESEGSVRSDRSECNNIYVGNIPTSFDETDLLEQFRGYRVVSVKNFTKQDKRVFAFLKCVDQEEVVRIVKEMNDHVVEGRSLKLRAVDDKLNRRLPDGNGDQRDNIRHRPFKSQDAPLPLIPANFDATNMSKPRPPQTRGNSQQRGGYIHSSMDRPPPLEVDDSRPPPLEPIPRNAPPHAHSQPRSGETRAHHAPMAYRPAEHSERRPTPVERNRRPRTAPSDGYQRSPAPPVSTYHRPAPTDSYHRSPSPPVNSYHRPAHVDGYHRTQEPLVDAYHRPAPAVEFRKSPAPPVDAYRSPVPNKYISYHVPPNSGYHEPRVLPNTELQESGYPRSAISLSERHFAPKRVHVGGLIKSGTPPLDTPVRVSPEPQNIFITTATEDEPDETVVVCVANFPYRTSEDTLFELFEDFSPVDVDIVENFPTADRNDFTYALVTLPNLELAEAAIFELDNTMFRRRTIIVQLLCGDDGSFDEGSGDPISPTIGITRTTTPTKQSLGEPKTLCERFSYMKMPSGARLFH